LLLHLLLAMGISCSTLIKELFSGAP